MGVASRSLAFVSVACVVSCSLFVSLDGLNDGGASIVDGASDVADAAVSSEASALDSSIDAGTGSTSIICSMNELVAYWPLDDGEGTTAKDCLGNTPGRLNGPVAWDPDSPDDAGASLYFNGAGGSVDFPTNGNALLVHAPFTISAWMQADVSDSGAAIQDLAVRYSTTTGAAWGIGLENGNQYYFTIFSDVGSTVTSSTTTYAPGTWRHVAGVIDSTFGATLYVDGELAGFNQATDIADASTPMLLGVSGAGNTPFSGHLAKVAFFNRALTSSEIFTLYSER